MLNPSDQWRQTALRALISRPGYQLVTTEEVLVEVLAYFAGGKPRLRALAATSVRAIINRGSVRVEPQSHDSFLAGLELYERRLDKGYSLVDCISMVTMRRLGITEILTGDRHFAQEGFVPLF